MPVAAGCIWSIHDVPKPDDPLHNPENPGGFWVSSLLSIPTKTSKRSIQEPPQLTPFDLLEQQPLQLLALFTQLQRWAEPPNTRFQLLGFSTLLFQSFADLMSRGGKFTISPYKLPLHYPGGTCWHGQRLLAGSPRTHKS